MRVVPAAAAFALVLWSGGAAAKNVGTVVLVGKPGPNNKFVVATDAGTTAGVKKGDTLCVYDEDDAEVTCGVVVVAKPTAASLFFDVAFLKRVKKGQRVELKAAPAAPAKPGAKPVKPGAKAPPKVQDNDDQDEGDELDGAATPTGKNAARKKLVVGYAYGALAPIAYNGIGFNPDSRTVAGAPTWTKRETVTSATVGFALAFHAPLSATLELATTLMVFQPDDVKGKTVMTSAGVTDEVSATTEGRGAALAVDAYYGFMRGASWQASAIGGLSFLQSVVEVNAKITPGTGDAVTIADYNSYLYALGVDLGAAFDYHFGAGFLAQLGVVATVPVTKLVSGSSGSTDFTKADLGEADHALKALDKAVDHKLNGAGARVGLGLGWSF